MSSQAPSAPLVIKIEEPDDQINSVKIPINNGLSSCSQNSIAATSAVNKPVKRKDRSIVFYSSEYEFNPAEEKKIGKSKFCKMYTDDLIEPDSEELKEETGGSGGTIRRL